MKSLKLFLLTVLLLSSCVAPVTPTATATPTSEPTKTFTPVPTSTQTLVPTPTITPTPTQVGGGSGRLLFASTKDGYHNAFPDLQGEANIFTANMDGTNVIPVTNGLEGYNYLMSVSPDGSNALITSTSNHKNKTASLYLANLDSPNIEPIKLANGLPNSYGKNLTAKWIDDSKIVYIGQGETGFGIYKINRDGTDLVNIYNYNNDGVNRKPFEFLAINGTRLYWDTRIEKNLGGNRWNYTYFVWWTDINDYGQNPLMFNEEQLYFGGTYGVELSFSPDGTKIAWTEPATSTSPQNYLYVSSISNINNPNTLETLTSGLILRWLPDGSEILVLDETSVYRSGIFGIDTTNDLFGLYSVSITPSLTVKNNHSSEVLDLLIPPGMRGKSFCINNLSEFSPDGQMLLFISFSFNGRGGCSASKVSLLKLKTMTFSELAMSITPFDALWIP